MGLHRSGLRSEVADAVISRKTINFDVVGSIIAKFGARATINGDATGVIINRRVIDACIPVHPSLLFTAGGLHGSQGGQALHEQSSLAELGLDHDFGRACRRAGGLGPCRLRSPRRPRAFAIMPA